MTREHLLHLLAEASELEHNLLCSYLFALFSLKRGLDEGLTEAELAALQRWRHELLGVCTEEMTHLAQVANLTAALGARPHFDRPHLPVAPGYHPGGIVVQLTAFNAETLRHFVFLERPDGVALDDAGVFTQQDEMDVPRRRTRARLIPNAPDYATVGEFYGVLRRSLAAYAAHRGDTAFAGGGFQLDGSAIGAPSLLQVRRLDDALLAIDRIVEQGEGSVREGDQSHFARFAAMLDELTRLQATRPAFRPARNVGVNPVMRTPQALERTHVTSAPALLCLDAFNAVYWTMLRTLGTLYDLAPGEPGEGAAAAPLVRHMLACMHLLSELADPLTRLAASDDDAGVMAGPSFTMFRHVAGSSGTRTALLHLQERCAEIAEAVAVLPVQPSLRDRLGEQLAGMAQQLRGAIASLAAG